MTYEQQEALLFLRGEYTLRHKNGEPAIDGIPGPALTKAIKKAQENLGLEVTGEWDDKTELFALRSLGVNGVPEVTPPDVPEWTGSFWDDPEVKQFFRREEFKCPCPRCGGFPVEPQEALVRACVWVRKQAEAPFIISSGVRCQAHNDELPGSVPDSRHVRGRAVDFTIPGLSPSEIKALADMAPGIKYSYIMSSGWVHMDIGN